MKLEVTKEMGQIKIGNITLPGIYDGCSISGSVKLDEIDIPGQSGKSTQPLGFEDASISLRLTLANDNKTTAYEKAKAIIDIFRAMDKSAKPYIYRIVNPMTNMWGIKEVIFKDLYISDSNYDDIISADLSLREYNPALVKKEAAARQAAKQSTTSADDSSASKGFAKSSASSSQTTSVKMQTYQESEDAPFADDDQPSA
jgi:hypothetical protein